MNQKYSTHSPTTLEPEVVVAVVLLQLFPEAIEAFSPGSLVDDFLDGNPNFSINDDLNDEEGEEYDEGKVGEVGEAASL